MVNAKSTVVTRRNGRKAGSGSWSRILLLAASEGAAEKSALETAVACFARRRLSAVRSK